MKTGFENISGQGKECAEVTVVPCPRAAFYTCSLYDTGSTDRRQEVKEVIGNPMNPLKSHVVVCNNINIDSV